MCAKLHETRIIQLQPSSRIVIPRVFHFVFGLKKQREQFHLLYYLSLKSCLLINQPDRIYFYYHYLPYGHYWNLIRPHLTLIRVPLRTGIESRYGRLSGERHYSYAHHADFIRVEQVLERGGVYADIDTLFLQPIPERLYKKDCVIGREDDVLCPIRQITRPSLCNAFFMATRKAPFLQAWLDKMPEYFDGSWSNHSCYLPWELSQAHPDWIHVEPSSTFYPYMWTREALTELFEGVSDRHRDACSLHLWNHLWWDRRRVDFSSFHQALINEAQIRTHDTTFNRLARPFLPDAPPPSWQDSTAFRTRDALGWMTGLAGRCYHTCLRALARRMRGNLRHPQ